MLTLFTAFQVECAAAVVFCMALLEGVRRDWLPLDPTEALGFVTGAICVWLVTRGNIWNWPVGLANNVVFAVLFWRARLFADFGLQWVYFALGVWGWRQWLHGGAGRTRLPVSHAHRAEWLAIGVFLVAGTWVIREALVAVNGSAPWLDALTTNLSLSAQYLLGRRRLENWWLWIAADLIYVPLYLSRGLPLTAALYAGFLGLCVVGLVRWKREMVAA
jgi:nicotinamide mononucleotide transporter